MSVAYRTSNQYTTNMAAGRLGTQTYLMEIDSRPIDIGRAAPQLLLCTSPRESPSAPSPPFSLARQTPRPARIDTLEHPLREPHSHIGYHVIARVQQQSTPTPIPSSIELPLPKRNHLLLVVPAHLEGHGLSKAKGWRSAHPYRLQLTVEDQWTVSKGFVGWPSGRNKEVPGRKQRWIGRRLDHLGDHTVSVSYSRLISWTTRVLCAVRTYGLPAKDRYGCSAAVPFWRSCADTALRSANKIDIMIVWLVWRLGPLAALSK